MKTKEGILFILLALVVLGAGCTDKEQKQEIQTLSVSGQWSPNTIDPHLSGSMPQRLGYAETLVGVDYAGKNDPKPCKILGSFRRWEKMDFKLRDGVQFHDGTPFTAEIMKESLERSFNSRHRYSEKFP